MKKTIVATISSISLLTLAACGGNSDTVVDSKAGKISQDEFYEALQDHNGEEVLMDLITKKVLEDNYEVSDDEVNEEYDNLKDQIGDDFDEVLKQQGISEDELKDDIRSGLLSEKAVTEGIEVSDEEIENFYENMQYEIKASHILVEDEETANKVMEELDDGKDFKKLAKEYSMDDANKDDGGDLGFFTIGEMVPEFEEHAFQMDKGDISEPVATDFGFHIIKVTDKKESDEEIGELDEVKEDIRQQIIESKINPEEAGAKINELIEDADIDIKIDKFKDILDQPAQQQMGM